MSIRNATLSAANIAYWPATYASLMAYLSIDRANPSHFSAAVEREFEAQDDKDALLRRWEAMTYGERLYVAACVISDEVTALADTWCDAPNNGTEESAAAAVRST